jgi:hypothetical protein
MNVNTKEKLDVCLTATSSKDTECNSIQSIQNYYIMYQPFALNIIRFCEYLMHIKLQPQKHIQNGCCKQKPMVSDINAIR